MTGNDVIPGVPLEPAGAAIAFVSVSIEVLGLLAWLGLLLAVGFAATWWYRSPRSDSVSVEYEPPSLPPTEVYEDALDYATSAEAHAERLYADGYYERATRTYEAARSAYEHALGIARTHAVGSARERGSDFVREGSSRTARERRNGVVVERPDGAGGVQTRLDSLERRIEDARRRRDFWRISIRSPSTNVDNLGSSRPNYEDLLDRGETSQWWGDRLLDDGHHANAYREYEAAREAYERALEIACEHDFAEGEARSRLNAVDDRMTECQRR